MDANSGSPQGDFAETAETHDLAATWAAGTSLQVALGNDPEPSDMSAGHSSATPSRDERGRASDALSIPHDAEQPTRPDANPHTFLQVACVDHWRQPLAGDFRSACPPAAHPPQTTAQIDSTPPPPPQVVGRSANEGIGASERCSTHLQVADAHIRQPLAGSFPAARTTARLPPQRALLVGQAPSPPLQLPDFAQTAPIDPDASGATCLQEADGSILKAKVQPVPTEVVWPSAELPPEHRPLLYAPKPIAWHKDRHNRMHTRLGPRRRVYRQGLAPESVAALTQARNMVTICSNPACRRLVDLHSALIDAHKEGRTELARSDGCTSHLHTAKLERLRRHPCF